MRMFRGGMDSQSENSASDGSKGGGDEILSWV